MTTKLLTEYKQKIQDLKLIPGGGGCFELSVNGETIYSKLKTGEFPNEDWAVKEVGKKLK